VNRSVAAIGLVLIALAPLPLAAYPDGAPWESADPKAAQNCASCHYSENPVESSEAILVTRLPSVIERGKTYSLNLALVHSSHASMGFLVSASRGTFSGIEDEAIEVLGGMARSMAPKSATDEVGYWMLEWEAPFGLNPGEVVSLYIAINAANDDMSPFGDVIHYRTIMMTVK